MQHCHIIPTRAVLSGGTKWNTTQTNTSCVAQQERTVDGLVAVHERCFFVGHAARIAVLQADREAINEQDEKATTAKYHVLRLAFMIQSRRKSHIRRRREGHAHGVMLEVAVVK